jgi:hypothetical protein
LRMTRPDYQMIPYRVRWRLVHRDCEFHIGSVARVPAAVAT